MKVIDADDSRMIDLPGVGPCPRPVDIDQRITGFKRLKSLRIYRFQPGPPVHGDSEVDEVFILPLAGAFDMAITGAHPLQAAVSAEGPVRALYMTPDHSYLLTPRAPVVVAYARAEAVGAVASRVLNGAVCEDVAEHLRYRLADLGGGGRIDAGWGGETLVHVIEGSVDAAGQVLQAGQTLALGGGEDGPVRGITAARLLIIGV